MSFASYQAQQVIALREENSRLRAELLSVMKDYAELSRSPDGVRQVIRERDATIASLRAELEAYRIAENRP